jgi:hypothetical protein
MTDILDRYGYVYEGACNCDGFKTLKYKNNSHQVRHRVRSGTFKIRQYGITKTNWKPITELENELKKYHTEVTADQN